MAMPPSPPSVLYKYVGDAAHHLAILRDLRIRFTQPSALNDPFDCIPATMPPASIPAFVDETIQRNASRFAGSGYTGDQVARARRSMIDEYTNNSNSLIARGAEIITKNLNDVGVLSLSEDPANLVLWAHYGANHAGFVVGFDSSGVPLCKKTADIKGEGDLQPIKYQAQRLGVRMHPLSIPPDAYYIKSDAWAYEKEWRIIRTLKRCDAEPAPGIHLENIVPATVRTVHIGMHAAAATRDAILSATAAGGKLSHVAVFSMQMDAGRVALQAVPH